MASIDELSHTIGQIHADIKHVKSQSDKINSQLQHLHEVSVENKLTVKSAHSRLDETNTRMKAVEQTVQNHEGLKNKGIGIVGFVGFVFGSFGALIFKYLPFGH